MLKLCNRAGACLILQTILQFQCPDIKFPQALSRTAGGYFGISSVIDDLLRAKRNANRRERYIRSLEYYLRQFSKGRENRSIGDFGSPDIEDWMSQYQSAYTKQTWLNRLSALFSFAVRRGYISSNPCDRIDRIIIDLSPPAILTVAQSRLLLNACPTICRPHLILGMFAGLRPEEIMRLTWDKINFETKTVFVDGKTRRRRYVPLEPIAFALLEKHPLKTGNVAPSDSTIDRWYLKGRKLLGLNKWPQDLLRHTAASYLIALHQDAGKVATMLGNSVKTLLSHYHEPVTQAACDAFWDCGHTKYDPVRLDMPRHEAQFYLSGKVDCQNQPQSNTVIKTPNQSTRQEAGSVSELSRRESIQASHKSDTEITPHAPHPPSPLEIV